MGTKLKTLSETVTHVGYQRKINEDSSFVANLPDRDIFVVSDGMGGLPAGEVASRIVCDEVSKILLDYKAVFGTGEFDHYGYVEILKYAVSAASNSIFSYANTRKALRGMGATVVVLYRFKDSLFVAHVGDSRCYLLQPKTRRIEPITRDHSAHGLLLEAVGPQKHVETEVRYISSPLSQAEAGNCFILCSDGLTNMVKDKDIYKICEAASFDPFYMSLALVSAALEAGGVDNITVTSVKFVKDI